MAADSGLGSPKIKQKYKLIFSLLIALSFSNAQSLKVVSKIDTTVASIGDQIQWNIKIQNLNEDNQLEFPELIVENDTISIISQRSIIEDNIIIGRSFRIAFWETGKFYTPSYYVKVLKKHNNKGYQIEAEKLLIHIKSVIVSGDSVKVRPIKSPIKVSRVIPYAIIFKVIIILILIYMVFIVWRRRLVKNIVKIQIVFKKILLKLQKTELVL